ncbi:MAG: hypothetical protein GJU72_02020 [Acidithiobacillus ferriphilus]|jgi:hypothetical protein|uniref:hypothetical protein n=1 Tax=Acidithiobacillus ferriphilus TaxID=1689834 RepID=UPI00242BE9E8|nr:hypothetical protein [Acidithiobacillus ferriphilus]MBW9247871.1 hypothetical protein [Acidithiobacillus ferriphilus]MBW9253881.1 hypothetical protein [Acidithiobacillus ferriphilus]
MITKTAFLLASLITTSAYTSAQAATAPPPPPAHQAAHLSTEQMFRNYMQSGSIYYGPHHHPARHVVLITKRPLLAAIQDEAPIFAGLQKP